LDQLIEDMTDYFQWQQKHPASLEVVEYSFVQFIQFVDSIACYFAPTGIPSKLAGAILKIARLYSVEVRERVTKKHSWRAPSLCGSTALWRDLKPALRASLESVSVAASDKLVARNGRKRVRE
jgi:hypothetical protein